MNALFVVGKSHKTNLLIAGLDAHRCDRCIEQRTWNSCGGIQSRPRTMTFPLSLNIKKTFWK